MSFLVPRSHAVRAKTRHQFMPGLGYVAHAGPPELEPHHARGTKNCEPPGATGDGTRHMLRPPTGAKPMEFIWLAHERAWESVPFGVGNRLAWPVAHMKQAGWEYVGPKRV